MFQIMDKRTGEVYTVYHVRTFKDVHGMPRVEFLIYDRDWMWVDPLFYYRPVTAEDI